MICQRRTAFTEGCITESVMAVSLASGLLRIIFPHESEVLDIKDPAVTSMQNKIHEIKLILF